MITKFTYHYSGLYQLTPATINYCDGIITVDKEICKPEDYNSVKKSIAMEVKLPVAVSLTILSLTLIGRIHD